VLAQWPSGVSVVTTVAGDGWHGMTASSFSSVSMDPPLVADDEALTVPGAFVRMLQVSRGSFVGNQCAISAVYLGSAQSAYDAALAATTGKSFADTGRPVASSPMHQVLFGDMTERLETAYLWIRRQLELETSEPPLRGKDDVQEGYFSPPLLVVDPRPDAALIHEEQSAPVVPLILYDTEEQVLAMANDDDLGLGASVWSADEDRAFAFARRLEAGFTFVNTHNRTGVSLRAPFGGVKRSGWGREYGEEGLAEYVQTCVVHAPAAFRAGGAGLSPTAYPTRAPGSMRFRAPPRRHTERRG
jgi:acyl-CoA reductase-like NAD-dependent aldehyde dehydrogenase